MVRFFKAWRKGDGRAASEIEALIESLRSQPPSERRGANVSLTDCGVSNAFVAPLVKATQDPDAYLRESAVCALGHYRLGDLRKARLAVLTALRSDAAPAVRAGAAGALSCCAEKAQAALLDALRDASPLVRSAAVSSLAAACGEVEIEALKRCMLTDQDPDVRHSAAYELGAMKDERLVSALLQAAHDASDVVRAAALYGVCESAREDRGAVLPAFIHALADPSPRVREQACYALRYSAAEAIAPLMQALADASPGVRLEAVIALGSLGATEALDAVAQLKRSDPDAEVRSYASHAWSDIRDARAAERRAQVTRVASSHPSSPVLPHPQPEVQDVAVLISLLGDEDDSVRAEAALALAAAADPRGFEPLKRLLKKEKSEYVRRRVVWALSFFPVQQCLPLLTHCLADPGAHVRRQAVLALAQVCDGAELARLLERLPRRTAGDVREALAQAIEDAGDAAGLPSRAERSVRFGSVHYE